MKLKPLPVQQLKFSKIDTGVDDIEEGLDNEQFTTSMVTATNLYNETSDDYTILGNNVSIGHSCTIHGCEIKDNVLIGMGAIIMNGAVIGNL